MILTIGLMALKSEKNDALSGAISILKEIIRRKKALSPHVRLWDFISRPKKVPIATLIFFGHPRDSSESGLTGLHSTFARVDSTLPRAT